METSLSLMLTAVNAGKLSLDRLVEMMHTAPAAIFHTPAQPDTFIDIEPTAKRVIESGALETKCGWTPFDGMELCGKVVSVVLRGGEIMRNGNFASEHGSGQVVLPLA